MKPCSRMNADQMSAMRAAPSSVTWTSFVNSRRSWGIWSGDGLGRLGERGEEGLVVASLFELKEKSEEMRLADLTGADNILGSLTVGEKEEKS